MKKYLPVLLAGIIILLPGAVLAGEHTVESNAIYYKRIFYFWTQL